MSNFRRIGVLTSGGDSPAMNATVKAVTCSALSRGVEVVGILGGYSGLIHENLRPLTKKDVSGIISLGGTIIYSHRCVEFKTEEGMKAAIENCKKHPNLTKFELISVEDGMIFAKKVNNENK